MLSNSFFQQVASLLRLRNGPQDLPYSKPLLWQVTLFAFGVELVSSHILGVGEVSPVRLVASIATSFSLAWLILSSRQLTARYVQLMTALMSIGAVFSLLLMPLANWALTHGLIKVDSEPTGQQSLFAWIVLALVCWKVAVTGSIWRHTLNISLSAGVGLAILIFIVEFVIDQLLFGLGSAPG